MILDSLLYVPIKPVVVISRMGRYLTWADPEGGRTGGLDPLPENHNDIGFLSNTGPDLLKNHKATKPAFNVGPSSASQRNAI